MPTHATPAPRTPTLGRCRLASRAEAPSRARGSVHVRPTVRSGHRSDGWLGAGRYQQNQGHRDAPLGWTHSHLHRETSGLAQVYRQPLCTETLIACFVSGYPMRACALARPRALLKLLQGSTMRNDCDVEQAQCSGSGHICTQTFVARTYQYAHSLLCLPPAAHCTGHPPREAGAGVRGRGVAAMDQRKHRRRGK